MRKIPDWAEDTPTHEDEEERGDGMDKGEEAAWKVDTGAGKGIDCDNLQRDGAEAEGALPSAAGDEGGEDRDELQEEPSAEEEGGDGWQEGEEASPKLEPQKMRKEGTSRGLAAASAEAEAEEDRRRWDGRSTGEDPFTGSGDRRERSRDFPGLRGSHWSWVRFGVGVTKYKS